MVTLAPTYMAERSTSPAFIILNDSLAKVLNVVKPPQKPVTSNNFISGDSTPLFTNPMSIPISKEPRTFTHNVVHGKDVSAILDMR